MKTLHISDHKYTSCDPSIDSTPEVSACGEPGPMVKWGYSEGLVTYGAMHPDFHCYACIVAIRRKVYS